MADPGTNFSKDTFKVFVNVRETVTFYMFIMEEAIQTAGMASYVAYKAGNIDRAKMIARHMQTELIDPLEEFAKSPAGILAFPMNLAYISFAEASRLSAETYLSL